MRRCVIRRNERGLNRMRAAAANTPGGIGLTVHRVEGAADPSRHNRTLPIKLDRTQDP